MKSKNSKLVKSFVRFAEKNPEMRFWQALLNWSGFSIIAVKNKPLKQWRSNYYGFYDTYYFEDKNG